MRVISFKADDELAHILEELARREMLSKSEIIRRAIRYYAEHANNGGAVYATRRIRVY